MLVVCSGCATSPKEKLYNYCKQYRDSGFITEKTSFGDRILWLIEGLVVGGYLGGGLMGWSIYAIEKEWEPAAITVAVASMVTCTILGWNFAGGDKTPVNQDKIQEACFNLYNKRSIGNIEDIVREETGSVAGLVAGSLLGAIAGTAIAAQVIGFDQYGSGYWCELRMMLAFGLGMTAGGVIGWNWNELF